MKKTLCLFLLSLIFIACKNQTEKTDKSFTFIEQGQYVVDSYNGHSIYRDKKNKKIMDGYYVVGNELTKWEEFSVKEGLLDGDYLLFHNNGEIFSHAIYSKGKKHGAEKTYYPSGTLKKTVMYANDVITGTVETYFESGQVATKATYKDGKSVESSAYDILGNIVSQTFIKDGRTITQTIRGGKVYSEQINSNYDSFEATKFYNEDGSLAKFLRFFEDGDTAYLIELDEDGNEIKRLNAKENPQELLEYQKYFIGL